MAQHQVPERTPIGAGRRWCDDQAGCDGVTSDAALSVLSHRVLDQSVDAGLRNRVSGMTDIALFRWQHR